MTSIITFFSFFVAGHELYVAVVLSIICFIPLVMMRSVRNLVAPPILIITDSKEFSFNFPTVSIFVCQSNSFRHLTSRNNFFSSLSQNNTCGYNTAISDWRKCGNLFDMLLYKSKQGIKGIFWGIFLRELSRNLLKYFRD